ncbi:flagellar basal-body MS-ring/collar protein FliF [Planctomicrobium sp. SH661]|uniref:flagellar basal-body MS-ring/collar protein FliF n=1 Tax=Planctomicrobium sp. SH661 TaxID=3448124 RepID=UPI003F5C8AD8
MDVLNNLTTQLQALWGRWNAGQRAGMVAALVVSVTTICGVGFWATTPEYVVVSDRMSPQQAAEVVSVLESENISYKLNYAGSSVSVPKSSLSRTRLALKDVLTTTTQETPEISEGIWSDPTLYQARMTRQLETRLSRSIMQLGSVRGATVHLTPGESSPFIRNRAPAKASVILDLQPNALFSATDARSIVSLVAHSVENLDPENVSVLDTSGRLLSASTGMEADVTGQLSYRSRVESDLSSKAEAILTQMLGPGHAVVRVTADIDFTDTQTKEIKYDPDAKVKVSETVHSESSIGGTKQAKGTVGLPPDHMDKLAFKADVGSSPPTTKVQSNTTQYENAKIEDTVHRVPGRISRLTVAAVVQLPDGASGENGQASNAVVTTAQIEKIIKQAVGFDAARQDEIEVIAAPLVGNLNLIAPVTTNTTWEKYAPLLHNISLGLAAIVALVLGLLVIRRMQPIVVEAESKETMPAEVVLKVADLSQQAIQNPEAVATVIRSWLAEPAEVRPSQRRAS